MFGEAKGKAKAEPKSATQPKAPKPLTAKQKLAALPAHAKASERWQRSVTALATELTRLSSAGKPMHAEPRCEHILTTLQWSIAHPNRTCDWSHAVPMG